MPSSISLYTRGYSIFFPSIIEESYIDFSFDSVLLLNIPAIALLTFVVCFTGLTVYAYYSKLGCDPILNGDVSGHNQVFELHCLRNGFGFGVVFSYSNEQQVSPFCFLVTHFSSANITMKHCLFATFNGIVIVHSTTPNDTPSRGSICTI